MNTLTLDNTKRKQHHQRVVLDVAPRNYDFLMELLGNFKFVHVVDNDGDSREDIIANLKGAAKDLKLIKAGKLKGRPLKDFLEC